MTFTNSPLVSYTRISPNIYGPRTQKIDTITPHVVVGHLSLETIGSMFARDSANASCNYAIDDNGRIGMCVEEKNISQCTSSKSNDARAITIEIASDLKDPYAITDKAMSGLISLCADVCKRNGIPKLLWKADKTFIGKVDQQNISVHRWFKAKACPGNYLYGRLGYVADEVNKLLLPNKNQDPSQKKLPYSVRVKSEVLYYRRGPGTNNPVAGQIRKGEVYTIVEEAFGLGSSKWGKLKSGAGWIALDFCTVVG